MRKDIHVPKVEDIAVAVIKEADPQFDEIWNVYLINLKNVDIEGVIVSSKGYGQKDGEKVKTSVIRRFFEKVPPRSYLKIEPIMQELFGLSNEYWVSFFLKKELHDKKFVFLTETIMEENFVDIPLINKKGVMIK